MKMNRYRAGRISALYSFFLLSSVALNIDFGFAQQGSFAPKERQKVKKPAWTTESYIRFQSFQFLSCLRYFHDSSTPVEETEIIGTEWEESFMKQLVNKEKFFIMAWPELKKGVDENLEILEFIDPAEQKKVRYFMRILENPQWMTLHQKLPEEMKKSLFADSIISSPAELKTEMLKFYNMLLDAVRAVPVEFRRPFGHISATCDEPPAPVDGFAALQASFARKTAGVDTARIVTIKALIHRSGKLLRAKIINPEEEIPNAVTALKLVKETAWEPAVFRGRPTTMAVTVLLRTWP